MPTITHIDTTRYSLPLKTPLRWGSGHIMPALDHLLVRVQLDDGAIGIAEINPRPTIYGETPDSVEAVIRDHIAPALIGQALSQTDDITQLIGRYHLLKHNNSARSGVDMALWDALAQSRGVSLPSLLGCEDREVRVSYILGTGTLDEVMREVETVVAAGVRVLKVKVGKDHEREVTLLERLQTDFPDVDFYVDANETYNVDNATGHLSDFANLGALYCEEPLPVRLLQERATLRSQEILPLIGDDSCFTLPDLKRELAFNTFDVLNIKPARTGFTVSLAMLATASTPGKRVMLGSQASSILGCIYTLMLATCPGVTEPSEGTFWLKVDDESQLPLTDGAIGLGALEEARLAVRARLLSTLF